MQIIKINPVAKPRMTQRDKWSKRPAVIKYWQYKDDLNKYNITLPENYHIHFILPMPKSWTKKKKLAYFKQPHKQKPDKDNLEKAFLDAILKDDSVVYDGRVTKWWGRVGCIVIQDLNAPEIPMVYN